MIGFKGSQYSKGVSCMQYSSISVTPFPIVIWKKSWRNVVSKLIMTRRNKDAAKKFLIKTMRKHGSPTIIITDKQPSYGVVFVRLSLLTDSCVVAAPTIGAKIHTFHFDDENEQCRSLRTCLRCNNSSIVRAKFTIILITRDT